MGTLIYEVASKSRSRKVHEYVYGRRFGGDIHKVFRPCGLDDTFRFECKMTGNCCRGRSLQSNVITGDSQLVPIKKFCSDNGIAVKGLDDRALWLDGLDPAVCSVSVADIRLGNSHKGLAYVGPHGKDCQFLSGNLCSIHPVKPVLCRAAPVGWVLEHLEYSGFIHLAIQEIKKIECPECCDGPERIVRDWIEGVISNDHLNDEREKAGYPRIGK
jgi:Fe-S-cluster containining protein